MHVRMHPLKAPQRLGLAAATALVLGNMVGSGIFLLPSSLAPYGAVSLVGWLFTSAGAVLLALVFAHLAARVPGSGGPYVYARAGFGEFGGFFVAWGYWISLWAGNAAIAVAFASYLSSLVPALATPMRGALAAIAGVWFLTALNARGVAAAGRFQLVTTVLKVVPLLLFAILGLFSFSPEAFVPFNPSGKPLFGAISAVATLTLWSFLGLESASIPAGDVENPERTIPRATLLGTLIAAAVYILATVAILGAVPRDVLAASPAPFADAAALLFGPAAGKILAVVAVISTFGALNGWVLLAGQFPAAVAADGLFPPALAKRSANGVPLLSLVWSSVITSGLLLLQGSGEKALVSIFEFAIVLATLATLLPYAFCSLVPLILKGGGARPSAFVIPLLAFAYSLWAISGAGAETVLYGFLLQLLGLVVWVWRKRVPG